MSRYAEKVSRMVERWSKHRLVNCGRDTAKQLTAYRLQLRGHGRMQSCFLVFTPEGIVIMGDWCPGGCAGRNAGVISCYGYSEGWFAGRLSPDYLASKFLRKCWQPEKGERQLKERVLEARHARYIERDVAREAFDRIAIHNGDGLTAETAYGIFSDAGLSDFEDLGYDYDPDDFALLVAIQQRFAACIEARQAVAA